MQRSISTSNGHSKITISSSPVIKTVSIWIHEKEYEMDNDFKYYELTVAEVNELIAFLQSEVKLFNEAR